MARKKQELANEEALKLFMEQYAQNQDAKKIIQDMSKKYKFDKQTLIDTLKQQAIEVSQRRRKKEIPTTEPIEKPTLNANTSPIKKLTDGEAVNLYKELYKKHNDPVKAYGEMVANYDFNRESVKDTIKKEYENMKTVERKDVGYRFKDVDKQTLTDDEAKKKFIEYYNKYGSYQKAYEKLSSDYEFDKSPLIQFVRERKSGKYLPVKAEPPLPPARAEPPLPPAKLPAEIENKTVDTVYKKGIPFGNFINSIVDALKNNKGKVTLASLIATIAGGAFLANKSKQQPPQQPQQPPQPPQQPQQPQQEQQTTIQPPSFTDYSSDYSNEIKQTQSYMLKLFEDIDKYRQVYDDTIQKYSQVNDIYEKQLLGIMPTIPLLLSKTPLNTMTNEDLVSHTNSLFNSMPYSTALQSMDRLLKGYYLAKMNGVDPSALSTGDLFQIADNPVLAKSVDENLATYLTQVSEILKFKIKSNLDKIGAVKDAYNSQLKELHEKGDILKEMLKSIKDEYMYKLNSEKADINTWYTNEKIKLLDKKIEMSAEQNPAGGKQNLQDIAQALGGGQPPQKCHVDKNGLPDLQCALGYK